MMRYIHFIECSEEEWHRISSNVCPECGGQLILHNGEIKCSECGLVVGVEMRDMDPYSESYDNVSNYNHQYVGDRIKVESDGIAGSYIDYYKSKLFKDSKGRALSKKKQKLFYKLKYNYDELLKRKANRSQNSALKVMEIVSKKLNIPSDVIRRATYYYKVVSKSGRRTSNHLVTCIACPLLTVRSYGIPPISFREIKEILYGMGYKVSKRRIFSELSDVAKRLDLKPFPVRSETYLLRMLNKLLSDEDVKEKLRAHGIDENVYFSKLLETCKEILETIPPSERGGRNQYVMTSAVIYASERLLSKREGRKCIFTQNDIGRALNIPHYSVRDHFSFLSKKLGLKRPYRRRMILVESKS
ncbi:MAG: hypothetical protein ACTSR0_03030 [Candidatus Asgardarchaeia archaeon]